MATIAPTLPLTRPRHGATDAIWHRYADFLRRPPLLVLEWADSETEARGWLVINSLRGGAAGGGTRMRAGLTRQEVVYLAKTMELKFAFSGPAIGGAKSGIDFDPTDPRRAGVLRRWFQAVAPMLHACYGTGGDLNVDEVADVIPACTALGIAHPQEGVVRGHLKPDARALRGILHALQVGVKAPVTDADGVHDRALPVADLVTGYGVARSIIRYYELQGLPLAGARVLIEGFGAVGGPCALYLARAGARIVGISDREKALLAPQGLDADEVERLVRDREDKLLPRGDARCLHGEERERFWQAPAEVMVAAAASGTLDEDRLQAMYANGVQVIASGANQPFREPKLGATRVQRWADAHFAVLPDVIANCGMARGFSFLMQDAPPTGSAPIFQAVDETITTALRQVLQRNDQQPTGLLAATLGEVLDSLYPPL